MQNINESSAHVPILKLGMYIGRPVYTYKRVEDDPFIAGGKKFFFVDVETININKLELGKVVTKDKKEVPGMKINEGTTNGKFVTLDDTSFYADKNIALELAKSLNGETLLQIENMKEEAEANYNKYLEEFTELGDVSEQFTTIINSLK